MPAQAHSNPCRVRIEECLKNKSFDEALAKDVEEAIAKERQKKRGT